MIINNKEEFEYFYPYNKIYIKEFPKEYPCICKVDVESGGIMGNFRQVYVAYYPNNMTSDNSFKEGLFDFSNKINKL